jgi:hypothetical protein
MNRRDQMGLLMEKPEVKNLKQVCLYPVNFSSSQTTTAYFIRASPHCLFFSFTFGSSLSIFSFTSGSSLGIFLSLVPLSPRTPLFLIIHPPAIWRAGELPQGRNSPLIQPTLFSPL